MKKVAYVPIAIGIGRPKQCIRRFAAVGVGDAHITDDTKDIITLE